MIFFRIYLFCSYIHVCFQLVAFMREYIWHKALLMEHSMRLELTSVWSLNDFQLVIKRSSSLFLTVCLPKSALSLIDIWYVSWFFCLRQDRVVGVVSCFIQLWFKFIYKILFFYLKYLEVIVLTYWHYFKFTSTTLV